MDLDVKLNINKLMSSPNIVDMLDERALNTLGYRVINEFNLDKESRIQWEKRVENAMKLALQVSEAKSFPWTNASNIKFPLVTIAALQFHSRAYPALIPGNDIIKVDYDIPGDTDPQALADVINRNARVEKHMSFQLLKEDECWEGEMDKVLITVPIVGCAFKKTYWDFNEDHPVSENVLAKDFVVSYWTKNLKDCNRQSHVLYLSVNDVLSRQRRGIWTDDFKIRPQQTIQEDDLSQAQDQAQGVYQPQSDPGTPFEFIEQHRWEDLDGDGFKEPYIITVHKDTRKVVRVVANYFENSIKKNNKGEILSIKPESYFTKYSFIPSPDGGFYDIGFGILLGPLNESINTIINQLVDAGTMANTAGGFLARGIKIRGGNYNFAPNLLANRSAPESILASLGSSSLLAIVVVATEVSTVATIFLRTPVTSSKASDKITSLSDLINESLAPALTIPIVMFSSSKEIICALVASSDQVNLRFPFTLSITSGHIRRRAVISILPLGLIVVGFATTGLPASTFGLSVFSSIFGALFTAAGALLTSAIGAAGAWVVDVPKLALRSNFSTLAASALSSPEGIIICPQTNSKINLGGVAPRI